MSQSFLCHDFRKFSTADIYHRIFDKLFIQIVPYRVYLRYIIGNAAR